MSATNLDDPRIVAGMKAQQRAREQAIAGGATRFGWKAGLGGAAARRAARLGAPLAGYLTDATRLRDGATVTVGDWSDARAEAELAVRVGRDVEPGDGPDRAAAAIDAIAPAIELVDVGAADDIEAVLAANIFHRAALVGEWADAATHPASGARLRVDGADATIADDVDPTTLLGDLAAVVAALAEQLPLAGDRLLAGDVVLTGSAIAPVALAGGERLTVTLHGAGTVGVSIA